MDRRRLLDHIRLHVDAHMPDAGAPPERWERWMAGTYNLLAILGAMVGVEPGFEAGVARLFRHWQTAPADHTPPPLGAVDACRAISSEFK
jgi:hypothetical protein